MENVRSLIDILELSVEEIDEMVACATRIMDDPAAYAESAMRIMDDCALRDRMVAEGREHIRAFSADNFAEGLVSSYARTLGITF